MKHACKKKNLRTLSEGWEAWEIVYIEKNASGAILKYHEGQEFYPICVLIKKSFYNLHLMLNLEILKLFSIKR